MTDLLYLGDFDVNCGVAKIVNVEMTPEGKYDLVLDRTVFYPKGGGQDHDQGLIASGSAEFNVEQVYLDEKGTVHHLGELKQSILEVGEQVEMSVDESRRRLNTRLHSAGHLVDMAVDEIGYDINPVKGSHYPGKCYDEYDGDLPAEQREQAAQRLNEVIARIIRNGTSNKIMFMPKDEMAKYCSNVPDYIPDNKPSRIVVYGEKFGIPCGGTHVRNVSDVGEVIITKIKKKSGRIRISYQLKDINL